MWVHGCKYVLETQPWDNSEVVRDSFYCGETATTLCLCILQVKYLIKYCSVSGYHRKKRYLLKSDNLVKQKLCLGFK